MQYYFGCYDPLQYPLLFPYGETGWHQGIQRVDKGKREMTYGETGQHQGIRRVDKGKGKTLSRTEALINPYESTSATELIERETQGISKFRLTINCIDSTQFRIFF